MNRDDLARREEDLAFVQRSLDDLDSEHASGDITDDDYETLRARYDARMERLTEEVADGKAALPARKPRNLTRTLTWSAAAALLAVTAGVLVARFAGQRAPTDTITGGANKDVNQLLVEARSLLAPDTRPQALVRFRQVLQTQPDNAEARTYSAWITRLDTRDNITAGKLDATTARTTFVNLDAEFDRAATIQPGLADPHCFQAVLRFRDLEDAPSAHQAYYECLSANPNQLVAQLVGKLGTDIDAALAATSDPTVSGLAKARIALAEGRVKDAIGQYDAVSKADPTSAEATTWAKWLIARTIFTGVDAGLIPADKATTDLARVEAAIDAVLVANPTFADASCVKVVLAIKRADTAAVNVALPGCRTGVATPEIRDNALRLASAPPPTTVP